jgi:hypothetical protein
MTSHPLVRSSDRHDHVICNWHMLHRNARLSCDIPGTDEGPVSRWGTRDTVAPSYTLEIKWEWHSSTKGDESLPGRELYCRVRTPKGQRSSTLWSMNVSGQLLATHHEKGTLMGSDRASGNDLVIENKPHRTRSWSMRKAWKKKDNERTLNFDNWVLVRSGRASDNSYMIKNQGHQRMWNVLLKKKRMKKDCGRRMLIEAYSLASKVFGQHVAKLRKSAVFLGSCYFHVKVSHQTGKWK